MGAGPVEAVGVGPRHNQQYLPITAGHPTSTRSVEIVDVEARFAHNSRHFLELCQYTIMFSSICDPPWPTHPPSKLAAFLPHLLSPPFTHFFPQTPKLTGSNLPDLGPVLAPLFPGFSFLTGCRRDHHIWEGPGQRGCEAGWSYSPVGRVLVVHALGPGFNPQYHPKETQWSWRDRGFPR